jgi:ABC-2 type transport system permease protein
MPLIPLIAMVRKDLQIFFSDRRSVIVSFVVPIVIASFFGSLFSGPGKKGERARVEVALVDQDGSAISRGIVASAQADENVTIALPEIDAARAAVRGGRLAVAVVIPPGFGDAAGTAFFGGREKPTLQLLYDPSRSMELAMVRGIMTQHVMQAVSQEMFGGAQGKALIDKAVPKIQDLQIPADQKQALGQLLESVQKYYNRQPASAGDAASPIRARGLTVPYTVREEAMTSGPAVAYNGYAHSFAGMAIQFLLFAMANLGMEILLERQRGLWKRLRSAPVSRLTLLVGKGVSGTIISMMILLVSFAFAMIVFRVRIEGSVLGFLAICLSCSMMAASFGLLVAALGNSPAAARGITTLAVLMMVMLGGAWVPAFVFPAWLQQATKVVPVRWAVDGLDSMTWRGIGLQGALVPTIVLLAFAAFFGAVAAARFRWEES